MALGEAFITIRADTSEFTADLEKLKAEVAATQFNVGVKPSGAASSAGTVTTAFTSEGSDEVIAAALTVADALIASHAVEDPAVPAATARIAELQAQILKDDLANIQVEVQAQTDAQAVRVAEAQAAADEIKAINATTAAQLNADLAEQVAASKAADAERVASAKAASDELKFQDAEQIAAQAASLALAADAAKNATQETEGLSAAFSDLLSHSNSFGALAENLSGVFKELPAPVQLAAAVALVGLLEAATVAAITAVSATADAALAKVGLSAASSIEDARNNLSATFGTAEGGQLSSSLLDLSNASGIAEASLAKVTAQLGGLGLSGAQALEVTEAFSNSIDGIGLHGTGATTALTGLESAFEAVAKQTTAFSVSNIDSFSQVDGALSKTAIVAQLVADGVGKNAAAVNALLAAGKVTTTQGLTAVTQVAAATPQTATPSFGGIADSAKNEIENALGEAFDNPALLAKVQTLATTIVNDIKKIAPDIESGFSDFVNFIESVLPSAFDLFQKGTQEADDAIKEFGPTVKNIVGDVDDLFTAITTKGTAANDILRGFESVGSIIETVFSTLKPLFEGIVTALGVVGSAVSLVTDLIQGKFDAAGKDVEEVFSGISQVGIRGAQELADGVLEGIKIILEGIEGLAKAAALLPSWLGGGLATSVANGIADIINGVDDAKNAVDQYANSAVAALNVTLGLNGTVITPQININPALDALSNLDSAALQSYNDVLSALNASASAGGGTNNLTGGLSGAQAANEAALGPSILAAPTASLPSFGGAVAAATGGSASTPSAAATAAANAAKTLATATQAFHQSLSTFDTAIGGAQTVAAVDSAFATLQTAIDTEDKALGKAEPTGLKTYLAKQQATLEQSAQELQLGLSTRTQFLADATVAVANPNIAGVQGIITQLRGQVANSLEFAADLKQLQKEGLNQTALNQLLAVGPTSAGLQAANDLIHATAAQITTINSLQTQAGASGESLGTTLGAGFQTAGAQAAEGLIDGLKSALPALETQMHALAETMDATIKKDLGISSPSKVFAQHGADIVAGLAAGIAGSAVPVVPIPALGKVGAAGRGGMTNTFNIEINGDLKNPAATASTIGNGIADVLLARSMNSALAG